MQQTFLVSSTLVSVVIPLLRMFSDVLWVILVKHALLHDQAGSPSSPVSRPGRQRAQTISTSSPTTERLFQSSSKVALRIPTGKENARSDVALLRGDPVTKDVGQEYLTEERETNVPRERSKTEGIPAPNKSPVE